jgi:hypothetical protein
MDELTEELRLRLAAHVLDASQRLNLPLPADDQAEGAA